jgi:hypothetical protein
VGNIVRKILRRRVERQRGKRKALPDIARGIIKEHEWRCMLQPSGELGLSMDYNSWWEMIRLLRQ